MLSSIERTPPPQFNSYDLGSPEKVWSLLYQKDEAYFHSPDIKLFKRHPKLDKKMRSRTLEWIMEVCADKKLHRETFHLCIDFFDRFLECTNNIDSGKLQLIVSTALVIAMKIEEIYPPKVSEISELTEGTCSELDIRDMEEVMLQKLEWQLAPVTAIHWLGLYLQLMSIAETQEDIIDISMENIAALEDHFERTAVLLRTPQKVTKPNLNRSEDSAIDIAYSYSTTHSDEHFEERNLTHDILDFSGVSGYSSHTSWNQHRSSIIVPKMMRDEFIRLSSVIDLAVMDPRSLNFKYSELAAAVVFGSYTPENLISQITGFRPDELQQVRCFIEPFLKVSEKISPAGTVIPHFSDIPSNDSHNIQLYYNNVLDLMRDASDIEKAMNKKEKYLKTKVKSRKREFRVVND